MSRTFAQYFQDAYQSDNKVGYIRAHYDVTSECNARIGRIGDKNNLGNILNKLKYALIDCITSQVLLPKAIIMVLEDDLLKEINHFKPGISEALGRTIEWIVNQFHRVITSHKETLPSKSRKYKYPTILWVLLPEHVNFGKRNEFRQKCNKSITSSVSLFREMCTIELLNWDFTDRTLVSNKTMTGDGYLKFWTGVDSAFESWDREQMKIKAQNKVGNQRLTVGKFYGRKQQRFEWKKDATRFKLPNPNPNR